MCFPNGMMIGRYIRWGGLNPDHKTISEKIIDICSSDSWQYSRNAERLLKPIWANEMPPLKKEIPNLIFSIWFSAKGIN